ncbi:MAG: hypothetical protein IJT15_03020 [Rickettsiales bacterium]|nr:hypothetical protein [Rickettsiales bacterium]
MSEEGKKEEKITFTIQGKKYEFTSDQYKEYDYAYHFNTPQKISFKIGDIENVLYIDKYCNDGYREHEVLTCSAESTISFEIGGVLNENVKIEQITIHYSYSMDGSSKYIDSDYYLYFDKERQEISFNIGDIPNTNVKVAGISVDHRTYIVNKVDMGYLCDDEVSFKVGGVLNVVKKVEKVEFNHINDDVCVYFIDGSNAEQINFKIRDINYCFYLKHIKWSIKSGLIKEIQLSNEWSKKPGIEYETFYYNDKKYKLNFKGGETIKFNKYGQLTLETIGSSQTRMNQIEEQDRIYNLEKKQVVVMKQDRWFIGITGGIGLLLVAFALGLCVFLPKNFDKMSFVYLLSFLDPLHETFNKYTFFYEVLKRAPIIILTILGFKFLQLAFERLRLIGKVEQVRNYIALTADDDTKKQLLKTIAIPFFAPKKVKSRFFDRLIDKTSINIGGEQKSGGVINKKQEQPLNDVEKP